MTTVSVCLSDYLSASISLEVRTSELHQFLFTLFVTVAEAQSFSGGVAICYAFPVLYGTSYLHVSQGCSTSCLTDRSACAALGLAINGAQYYQLQGDGRTGLLLGA